MYTSGTRKSFIKSLSYTVIFNTLIALFLTGIHYGRGLLINFVFSQCIGISICLCVLVTIHYIRPRSQIFQVIGILIAMIAGSLFGGVLGSLLSGFNPMTFLHKSGFLAQIVFLGIMFGSIISYIFISRERMAAAESMAQEERIHRLKVEKGSLETHLRLLQAQIEPHFLFNTLSNVHGLMDTDLEKGKAMIEALTNYLRISLARSRKDISTLGQEIELIQDYLNIYQIRMGNRLQYRLEIDENIKGRSFPPMLLQPLVENAVRHGLEPRIDGGEVSITAKRDGHVIRIEISDNGPGMNTDSEQGIGLKNIRERIEAIYGEEGRLILEENRPSGLTAGIEIPYGQSESHYRRR
ncbi:MAG: histidine kinase [Deltaproteobacteria bacterium]|nr:histidine kinase [Deltaproteobacteria bacterium]